MRMYTREQLKSAKSPRVEVDDFEFIALGRADSPKPPYPRTRFLHPELPRERLIVISGEVTVAWGAGRVTLKRRDWIDVPKEGVSVVNDQSTQAQFARIAGHWLEATRTDIAVYMPETPARLHYHDADEYWFVYRGRFGMMCAGRRYDMRPGLMLTAWMGEEHGAPDPEEPFEAVVLATRLEGARRDGLLFRETHGDPIPMRGLADD